MQWRAGNKNFRFYNNKTNEGHSSFSLINLKFEFDCLLADRIEAKEIIVYSPGCYWYVAL